MQYHVHNNCEISSLFSAVGFTPNGSQRAAILHEAGPLFLTAGPGSGKTRVLLWRTVNLIVCKDVPPERIFLSTFTEKAAHQLKEGLRYLLAIATSQTGRHYDISGMAVGTVHSICRQMITDRRFSPPGARPNPVVLLDELTQYFQVSRRAWNHLVAPLGKEKPEDAQRFLNKTIEDADNGSKHLAVLSAIKAFNRFAEESILPERELACDDDWKRIREVHAAYINWLDQDEVQKVDLSLLQQKALQVLQAHPEGTRLFDHVIVDEYQDTNAIQEDLFFHLAGGSTNLTVVGDDDQALYRFRGATVENLVQFPDRCAQRLGVEPTRIDLNINYRSRSQVVDVYTHFIDRIDWRKQSGQGHYRVQNKNIQAHRQDALPSVVVTEKADSEVVYAELAAFIKQLKQEGKINDYNEVAVLFPSVRPYNGTPNAAVTGMRDALEAHGIRVYAPRAGRFLETEEATVVMGLLRLIIGTPHEPEWNSPSYQEFRRWLSRCRREALPYVEQDKQLKAFIEDRVAEKQQAAADLTALQKVLQKKKWAPTDACTPEHVAALTKATNLSTRAIKALSSKYFRDMVANRAKAGNPLTLTYVLNRTTALDWNVLDLFYQLAGFAPLRSWFQLAEDGTRDDYDEGPICNLALLSQYIGRYQDEFTAILTGWYAQEERLANSFFRQYCYALWRLGESEYENDDDPFPRGRVPFLTIHQSKGLEFKVVILGNMGRRLREPSPLEVAVRDMLGKEGEPLERHAEFDAMRLFYVALSRAKDLLVFVDKKGGHVFPPLKCFRDLQLPKLHDLDIATLPPATAEVDDMGKAYSFTGDYTSYLTCPRQYMIFDKYGFVPSRQQTRLFGHLVHRTVEDLHQFLIAQRHGH
jgi:DNA helicase-2/ATP-dependent DNA helicase PcrA